jgi:hypothetical protein
MDHPGRQGTIQGQFNSIVHDLKPPLKAWLEWSPGGRFQHDSSSGRISNIVPLNQVAEFPAPQRTIGWNSTETAPDNPRPLADAPSSAENKHSQTPPSSPSRLPRSRPSLPAEPPKSIDDLLAMLRSRSVFDQDDAALLLAARKPEEKREEVARALLALVADKRGTASAGVCNALRIWATPETVPGLIARISDNGQFVNAEIVTLLGTLKDPRAAEPLAALLPNFFGKDEAKAALLNIGRPAESAVIPYLNHQETDVRLSALEILMQIGSKRSILPLRAVLNRRDDRRVLFAARRTLQVVEKRYADEKKAGEEGKEKE